VKKALIVTYYWPPSGGPGVQRWLKFVKYLPDFNVHPVVYIPENPTYPILDYTIENDLQEVTILKQKIKEPYFFASLISKKNTKGISSGFIPNQKKQNFIQKALLWIRGNLFIPDARVLWVKPSVVFLNDYIKNNNIETLITTGPPHSLHLIGLKLKEENKNLNWIVDFRDPWTTIGYHKALKISNFAQKKHKFLEHKVLNCADSIIVTSPTTKKEFEHLTSKPIVVITNGFDDFPKEVVVLDKKFTIAHIGSFLSNRNPKILLQILEELVSERPEFATNFEFKIIGKVSEEILKSIESFNLNRYVNNLGYVSHKEAVMHQKSAQVLLLIEIDSVETKCIIPGKLFEYMNSGRPIIGIGPMGSDFERIIDDTQTGFFVNYSEKEKLKKIIVNYFNSFLTGNLIANPIGIEKYSRKHLTSQLAELILQ
jgi:glycosyltransferase involved in cell wall biosynthesis